MVTIYHLLLVVLAIWLVTAPHKLFPDIVSVGADFTGGVVCREGQAFRQLQGSTLDNIVKFLHEGFEVKIFIQVAIVVTAWIFF